MTSQTAAGHDGAMRVHPSVLPFPDFYGASPSAVDAEERKRRYETDNRELRKLFGDRHLTLKFVLVVGTNGKGSVTEFLTSSLMAAGFRVGTITTPALVDATEMIRVDSRRIPLEDLDRHLETVTAVASAHRQRFSDGQPSQYALILMAAYAHFIESNVDVVVAEAAMGGRFDPTAVPNALMTVVTSISNDHAEKLGPALVDIAANKAHAIGEESDVVVGPQTSAAVLELFRRVAGERRAGFTEAKRGTVDWTPLDGGRFGSRFSAREFGLGPVEVPAMGTFQGENLATAITAIRVLRERGHFQVPDEAILASLRFFKVPGRMELVCARPIALLDGAHNLHATQKLVDSLRLHFPGRRLRMIVSMNRDKELTGQWRLLQEAAYRIYATRSTHARAWDEEAARAVCGLGLGWHPSVLDAWRACLDDGLSLDEDIICVAGSLYLVGDFWRHRQEALMMLRSRFEPESTAMAG